FGHSHGFCSPQGDATVLTRCASTTNIPGRCAHAPLLPGVLLSVEPECHRRLHQHSLPSCDVLKLYHAKRKHTSEKASMTKSAIVFLTAVFCSASLMAQRTFVYTNNDRSPNSISAFSAAANGSLSPVSGSPFATGGNGAAGGFFAANRITTAVVKEF